MRQPPSPSSDAQIRAIEEAWTIVATAADIVEGLSRANEPASFALSSANAGAPDEGIRALVPVEPDCADVILTWDPVRTWQSRLAPTDPRSAVIDLYLPVCSATKGQPITIGHLGQSLDGFIATQSGDSQFVTGPENILHLHRMRALCDAIVVGAGTVAADDPLLTTRRVMGTSPVRVILDPSRRLDEHYKVFSDDSVETLYVCARSMVRSGETHFGRATLLGVDETPLGIDVTAVLQLLRSRDCYRIFVEGGGVTVSMFLEADLLDRLQVAIAPLIIGNGRPAIRLPAPASLSDCPRPPYRVFRMGGDVFFDCQLKPRPGETPNGVAKGPLIARVI